eukprot:gene3973-4333_t
MQSSERHFINAMDDGTFNVIGSWSKFRAYQGNPTQAALLAQRFAAAVSRGRLSDAQPDLGDYADASALKGMAYVLAKSPRFRRTASFLEGQAGQLALLSVLAPDRNQASRVRTCTCLVDLVGIGHSLSTHLDPAECEILYDRAGYLCSLLYVRQVSYTPAHALYMRIGTGPTGMLPHLNNEVNVPKECCPPCCLVVWPFRLLDAAPSATQLLGGNMPSSLGSNRDVLGSFLLTHPTCMLPLTWVNWSGREGCFARGWGCVTVSLVE